MNPYSPTKYFARKKLLKLFGGEIKIFDENRTNLLFKVKQKAFRLKESITVYGDENQTLELLQIDARSMIDFSAVYDVKDLQSGEPVGSIRRKGFKSIMKDHWEIMDRESNPIGSIEEDSYLMAILRRFLSNLIPQTFHIKMDQSTVGILSQTFNPFVPQFRVDFSMDPGTRLDRRLAIAGVILLQIIEGRQE